jgi:hypothetical protein
MCGFQSLTWCLNYGSGVYATASSFTRAAFATTQSPSPRCMYMTEVAAMRYKCGGLKVSCMFVYKIICHRVQAILTCHFVFSADGAFEVLADERDRALDAMSTFWCAETMPQLRTVGDPHNANYDELDQPPRVAGGHFQFNGRTYRVSVIVDGVKKLPGHLSEALQNKFVWPGKSFAVAWKGEPGFHPDMTNHVPAEVWAIVIGLLVFNQRNLLCMCCTSSCYLLQHGL